MVDAALQRLNMVESQVRPSDVVDRRILAAMSNIEREKFVPVAKRSLAYMDEAIQLEAESGASARVLLPPRLLAKMIQNLELEDSDLVLDIACATGYSTAVLAAIAQTVVGLECDVGLADQATKALGESGVDNAVVVRGALLEGYPNEGPYDAILVNGAITELPDGLLDQLKDGGRLVAIQAGEGVSRAAQWRRFDTNFDHRRIFDAAAPILPGCEMTREFVF
ncbi:MAG: protein-L-isoaspartate O-methyltransferase family protein [Hyphomicrobiaceae bacterium]